MESHLCDYGCGKPAIYQFKNGKWCCTSKWQRCSYSRKTRCNAGKQASIETIEKHRKNRSHEKNPMFGKHHSEETKNKIKIDHKGKTWDEIFGKEKAKILREKQRLLMLNGLSVYASSFIKNPSRPQVEIYTKIKEIYSFVVLNYSLTELNYSLDIAIPNLKIWIESDGLYWHQDKEKDLERQKKIKGLGWKCIRYEADTIKDVPSLEKIKEDIENLISKNLKNNK